MKKQNYTARQIMLASDYEIFHYKDTYTNEVTLHHHDFYEIYFFLSGEVRYLIEGKIYKLIPGDIVIINSNELHQPFIESNSKSYERIVLWISKEFVKSISTDATDFSKCFEDELLHRQNVLRASIEQQQSIKMTLIKLLNNTTNTGFGSDVSFRIYISEILLTINQALMEKEKGIHQDKSIHQLKTSKPDSIVESVISYIEEHIEEEITLDDIAAKFYISKFYLSRVFKRNTNTTIHRYIVQKKLISAKELILKNIPLTEVYKRIGFGDYCNFLRAFKAEYGITPSEFYRYMTDKSNLNI